MKTIKLSGRAGNGRSVFVDDEDFEALSKHRWFFLHGYAGRNSKNELDGLPRKVFYMHRLLMKPGAGIEIDHKDGNGLNNTRANLRLCTSSENKANKRIQSNNNSGFKGVSKISGTNSWRAEVCFRGVKRTVGQFKSPELARAAYRRASKEIHGEFSYENRPNL